ncbi:hypothetical protein Abiwalacus_11330 [Akkermansia biwaensis]|uniref:Tetratricopeptide repeat protein n=3 Tax=Akkermansiaceae TaxID=1647988 RepID=A0ABN6QG91_9BACT|nr:hypothetical protein [uncultured Akkermansia sp.]BDL43559.1 hypothetical protein Abiwalacus_11330 [Akkermansia biwaensis]
MGQMMYNPPATGGTPAPASPQPANPSGSIQPNAYQPGSQGDAKSLYGNELPFLNPQDGTVTINGQTLNMGSFREIEARFNKYLSQPEENTEDAREYQKIFNKIHDVLSMRKERLAADNVLRQVVDLLTAASSNPLDGGVSDALCQAIYTAWQAKTNGKNKGKMMDAMEREIRTNTQKMSLMESGVTTSSGSASNQKGGKKGNSDSNPARDNPRYKYLEKRVVEMQARKLKLETEQVLTVTEAKIVFQSTLVQLFAQRRFDHVSIGCGVYSRLFNDGDTKLRLEKGSDAAKMFGGTLGVPPTVSVLDNLSRELARDSDRHMKAVNNLVDSHHYVDALERLNEALLIGEFMAPVSTFPYEKKQKLYAFKRDVEKLFELMNGKDYEEALTLVEDLKKTSRDFSTGRAESAISAAVFASDAYIAQGQEALAKGDRAKLEECLKKAIEIWPKNPRLLPLRNAMMAAGQQSHALEDFKRFHKNKNYRRIFDNQHEFAVLVKDDPELQAQFVDDLAKMAVIERALGAARQREAMQDVYGAWEELQQLRLRDQELFVNDQELNSQYLDLTTKASRLVKLLDDAENARNAKEVGSALGKYMEAKKLYLHSRFAKEGIESLLDEVLPLK